MMVLSLWVEDGEKSESRFGGYIYPDASGIVKCGEYRQADYHLYSKFIYQFG